jgi:hypothetical protein
VSNGSLGSALGVSVGVAGFWGGVLAAVAGLGVGAGVTLASSALRLSLAATTKRVIHHPSSDKGRFKLVHSLSAI